MSTNFNLNTNEYLSQCDAKDVISFDSDKWTSVEKLEKIVYQSFANSGVSSTSNHISHSSELKNSFAWFSLGEKCEILRAGSQGWKKGKVKINITLEFIPDEIEENKSLLDDVRHEINQKP